MKKSHLLLACAMTLALTITGCGSGVSTPAINQPAAKHAPIVASTSNDFIGTWQYGDTAYLMDIFEDGIYCAHHYDGTVLSEGSWEMAEDCIVLTDADGNHFTDLSFTANADLYDSVHDTELYTAVLPETVYASEEDFVGTWEYTVYPAWIIVNEDMTYTYVDYSGRASSVMDCYIDNGTLVLNDENGERCQVLSVEADGGLVDSNMDYLFASELPTDFSAQEGMGGDYDYANAIPYFGCWKYNQMNLWLYIYPDGTYEYVYDDGSYEDGYWYLGDDCMFLENLWGVDTDLVAFYGSELVDQDGDVLSLESDYYDSYLY